jgi:hypothetical protein
MPETVDLFLFAGQSNMAGRGITCPRFPDPAPALLPGAGWEFRAVSSPDRLFPIEEPFGVNENRRDGISESIKTGSMVTAFANAYYTAGHVPLVGVSASKGGSVIAEWMPGSAYLTDALARLQDARIWLQRSGYILRHIFCLWCQGESDADAGTAFDVYRARFLSMFSTMSDAGIEHLFMVRIGRCNIPYAQSRYDSMIRWQDQIAREVPGVTMASRLFADMQERGLMKDDFHYYQAGYNEVGQDAGTNAADFVLQIHAGVTSSIIP